MHPSKKLTLQAYLYGQWCNIAHIKLDKHGSKARLKLEYIPDHALDYEEYDDIHAASLNYPPALFSDAKGGWLYFLDDITPSGPGLGYWLNQLDYKCLDSAESLIGLLRRSGTAPIGHLRVLDALLPTGKVNCLKQFTIDDVSNRCNGFVELAHSVGATAVSGEAPKFLVRSDHNNNVWVDVGQESFRQKSLHYLVKFPRGKCLQIDRDILRAEYHYYQELADLGYETISTDHMRLEEGIDSPSLWLPRFDIGPDGSRLALESLYSVLNKKAGEPLDHEQTIRVVVQKSSQSFTVKNQGYHFEVSEFVIEWVRRDLLNIAFGNSDNHGRNTSFLRGVGWIRLAPIYDFAPMRADPEGIPRSMRWAEPLEYRGELNFSAIAAALNDLVEEHRLLEALCTTAEKLVGLKERLATRGVPKKILEMPSVGLVYLDGRLKEWGLL